MAIPIKITPLQEQEIQTLATPILAVVVVKDPTVAVAIMEVVAVGAVVDLTAVVEIVEVVAEAEGLTAVAETAEVVEVEVNVLEHDNHKFFVFVFTNLIQSTISLWKLI